MAGEGVGDGGDGRRQRALEELVVLGEAEPPPARRGRAYPAGMATDPADLVRTGYDALSHHYRGDHETVEHYDRWLDALLADGRRMLLLDDRGWSGSGPPDIWARTSMEEMVFTARTVVGPDEPPPGRTQEEEAAGHWAALAGTLQQQGVAVDGSELAQLPHDVVLSDRLLARLNP